ncbi:MAG TPA: radical SAM protein, partial [Planctomycetota bacterium]|nr:radical SAM protein [Planctomycetota bacterium]
MPSPLHGRGASSNPANRYERLSYAEGSDEERADGEHGPATHYLRDVVRSVVAFNQSPDVGFEASVNPYRGCEHGCI